jgi:hypothetical protein
LVIDGFIDDRAPCRAELSINNSKHFNHVAPGNGSVIDYWTISWPAIRRNQQNEADAKMNWTNSPNLEVKPAETPTEMRQAIFELARELPMARNCLMAADHAGMSGEDRYTLIAYHALRMMAGYQSQCPEMATHRMAPLITLSGEAAANALKEIEKNQDQNGSFNVGDWVKWSAKAEAGPYLAIGRVEITEENGTLFVHQWNEERGAGFGWVDVDITSNPEKTAPPDNFTSMEWWRYG